MIFEELSLEELNYITLFNGKLIDINDYLNYHQRALDVGEDYFLKYYDQNKSLDDNLKQLGVKDVSDMSSSLYYLYHARALYLADDKSIYIHNEDVEDIYSLIKKENKILDRDDIKAVMIAHELFHHLENIMGIDTENIFKQYYGNDKDYRNYKEIAAHQFAYLVMNIYPQYFDYLWLKYYHLENLEKYHNYYHSINTSGGLYD